MTGFDTTPDPQFLVAMQNQKWDVAGALAELVDNAFGEGRGNAREVTITHYTQSRRIEVLDNGQGMQAVGRLFQLGNTIGKFAKDIGLYGSGGTMAILWLSRKVTIWTLRDGRVSHDTVVWKDAIDDHRFPVVSDEWKPATAANTPPALYDLGHGTLIVMDLMKKRTFYPSAPKRELASRYAPALRQGRRINWVTVGKDAGTEQLADPLELPDDDSKKVDLDFVIEYEGEHLAVEGVVGLIEGLPDSRSKVAIGFGPRIITRTTDCYRSTDTEKRYGGTGIAGYLDLSDEWRSYLATTKDAMDDKPLWDRLMAYVFDKIEPLLKEVETERLTEVLIDLAIGLESGLNGAGDVDVSVAGKRVSGPEREGGTDGDDGGGDSGTHNVEPLDKDGTTAEKPDEESTRLDILPYTDSDLEGVLCKVEVDEAGVLVKVNKEHPKVQLALEKKPVNVDLLNFMVASAMAPELERTGYHRKLFKPSVVREIEEHSQPTAFLTRILVDLMHGGGEKAA